jgi:hypothetical protein
MLIVLALVIAGGSAAKVPGDAASTAPSWRPLPKPPLAGRLGASVAWTGREMIVWGGITSPGLAGFPYPQADGAAYNPRTRRWRAIARAPSGVLGGGSSASAWTGREMAVWVGNSPQGPAAAATFNPRNNAWRRLPSGPLGVREGSASVWTGSELLVFGGHTGGVARPTGAALDPLRRSWRQLPGLASVGALGVAHSAVWNGREAFVAGQVSTGFPVQPPRAILFAFNPRTEKVRPIDLSKAPVQPSQRIRLFPVAWTGGELLLLIGARSASSSIEVLRYNPLTTRWRRGKTAPCAGSTQTAWIGDGVVAACGANAIAVYRPRTDRWQTMRTAPSPLATRQGSAIAWTGTQLIVWSGVLNRPGNPTPPDGASIELKR